MTEVTGNPAPYRRPPAPGAHPLRVLEAAFLGVPGPAIGGPGVSGENVIVTLTPGILNASAAAHGKIACNALQRLTFLRQASHSTGVCRRRPKARPRKTVEINAKV